MAEIRVSSRASEEIWSVAPDRSGETIGCEFSSHRRGGPRTILHALVIALCLGLPVQSAFAAQPGCGPEFSKLVASSRSGAIPEFSPFFKPVLSRAELEQTAAKISDGTTIKKFVEHGYNTWSVEKLKVNGESQVVAVKRSRMAGESRQETRVLNLMADLFQQNGIDKYFHVVRPYETGEFHTVYPLFEARDMRELAREATAKITKKNFRSDDENGGPIPKGIDLNVDRLWARFEEGIEVAIKSLKKAGYRVQRVKMKSMTTGESYVDHIQVMTPSDTAPRDVIGFTIRSTDILVTTDGRFVIIDPY